MSDKSESETAALSVWDAVSLIIGIVIGTIVFIVRFVVWIVVIGLLIAAYFKLKGGD